jgi:hypothetical protein
MQNWCDIIDSLKEYPMKKLLSVLAVTLLMGGVVSAQQLELKEVITRSARGIEGELPQKAKVAVLNFESPLLFFSG